MRASRGAGSPEILLKGIVESEISSPISTPVVEVAPTFEVEPIIPITGGGVGTGKKWRGRAMESGTSARRRRLVERGSDRLAFITGQARFLPPDRFAVSTVNTAGTRLPEQQPSEGGISRDDFSNINHLQNAEPSGLLPKVQPIVEVHKQEPKDETLREDDDLLQKFKTNSSVPEIEPVIETPLRRHDEETSIQKTSDDAAAGIQPRRDMEMRPRSMASSQPNHSTTAAWSVETLKEQLNFSPHEISESISASENNRHLTAIIVAFLVVLSSWGLDIGGAITRVLVSTRPLLFLILTDVTIVVGLLMANRDANRSENAQGLPTGCNLASVDSIGQMLEMGLLLQKAMGALLMDCSICAVIMICFLGF